jgi:hypothetical protein
LPRLAVPVGLAWVAFALSAAGVPEPSLSALARLTRVTPSTPRRRAMTRATLVWLLVQPTSSIAGTVRLARSVEPLTPPTFGEIEPVRLFSVTPSGSARERSRSACSQSKRTPARVRTVSTRWIASASKSA